VARRHDRRDCPLFEDRHAGRAVAVLERLECRPAFGRVPEQRSSFPIAILPPWRRLGVRSFTILPGWGAAGRPVDPPGGCPTH
jgi:hypothetical protein